MEKWLTETGKIFEAEHTDWDDEMLSQMFDDMWMDNEIHHHCDVRLIRLKDGTNNLFIGTRN
jgi:hypothetical protein